MQQPIAAPNDQEAAGVVVQMSEEDALGIAEQEKEARAEVLARLDALGQSLARTRAEAIAARKGSGIEEVWMEDEEFYQGIDDANRNEAKAAWRTKPPNQESSSKDVVGQTRSTVFPNITGPFVEAAAARISDMLLPSDDRAWALQPTPIPDLEGSSKGEHSPRIQAEALALANGDPQGQKNQLAAATEAAVQLMSEANTKAEKAEKRIEDWHVECQWHAEVRKVIEDSARIGTGILKGPVPHRKKATIFKAGKLVISSEIKPTSKWIDPWDFYPDGACGESIQNGSYTWERDYLTRKQLRDLLGQAGYIDEAITAVLEEGPQRATEKYKETPDPVSDNDPLKDKYELWCYHGTAEKEDLEAAGVDCEDVEDPHVPAMIVMVNNRVIKAAMNPLDTGEFPYDVMVWRRRSGHWTGIGVGRQIRTPQRIITAATRNLMDNAGLAAGPMIVFRQGVITRADGKPDAIGPRVIWYIAPNADEIADATKAIGVIKVDMLVEELLRIVDLGLKLAEHVTGLPMLLQGQMGKAPDTLGGMQMLNNNASAVLRRLARLFDDRITEPQVRRYYAWLLQYGEDDEKGDYCIDARGSSALVERDLQNQQIMQMASIVSNPIFGLDPKKWSRENLLAQHFDPKRFEFDDEKWQKIVENMGKGPQDPRMAIAQMRTEFEDKWKQAEMAFEDHHRERDRQLDYIIAEMDQASSQASDLTGLKKTLADTSMKLRAQFSMQRSDQAAQLTKPPTEPAGKAKPGEAYQR